MILLEPASCVCFVLFATDLVHADALRCDALLNPDLHVQMFIAASSIPQEDAFPCCGVEKHDKRSLKLAHTNWLALSCVAAGETGASPWHMQATRQLEWKENEPETPQFPRINRRRARSQTNARNSDPLARHAFDEKSKSEFTATVSDCKLRSHRNASLKQLNSLSRSWEGTIWNVTTTPKRKKRRQIGGGFRHAGRSLSVKSAETISTKKVGFLTKREFTRHLEVRS